MDITVILCTYNRCETLARALESLAASVVPETVTWEVLVVDNNSKDHTREAVESISSRFPGRFRYLFEPLQGKSNALNAGIRDSFGSIVAFVDDDVIVEPRWLHNLTSGLLDRRWTGAGGRILPSPDFVAPRWLALRGPNAMGAVAFAHFDLGDEARELDQPPYGTNMAFLKDVFAKYGNFRTDIGPCPGSEIRNEDTEFGRRLLAGGEPLLYVPSAIVYHEVLESRLKEKYFLAWWFDFGRARIREVGVRPRICGLSRRYFSICNNIVRILPFRLLCWMVTVNSASRFYNKCIVWKTAGVIVETWRQSRNSTWDCKLDNARDAAY